MLSDASALALEVLQQQIGSIDDFVKSDDLSRLISKKSRFEPGVYLGGDRPLIGLRCGCNLFSETRWNPQIELWVILRHGEQMTQNLIG